jgi:hypothetical protein
MTRDHRSTYLELFQEPSHHKKLPLSYT